MVPADIFQEVSDVGQHFYFRNPAGGSVGAGLWEEGGSKSSKAGRTVQEMDAESLLRVQMTGLRDSLRICDFVWDCVVR